jgi:hypothetical protein
MFLQADTSFEDACKQLQEIRPQVDLHSIINPQPRRDGRFTEDMNPWIRDCEKLSTKEQYYRQVHPMIHTSHGPLGAVALGGTRKTACSELYHVDWRAHDASAELPAIASDDDSDDDIPEQKTDVNSLQSFDEDATAEMPAGFTMLIGDAPRELLE